MTRDPEPRESAVPRPETVREAQRIIGELVWLSTKCRPDLMLVVSRLASMITRDPELVIESAPQVWGYLAASIDDGLVFRGGDKPHELNIYSDSSFGDSSHGCTLVMLGRSLLLWKSAKQAIITMSTAEAELVEVMDAAGAGDAIRVVVEEALDISCRPTSFTDSSSALAIVAHESGSWRTRHLRKRAIALRDRVLGGDWMIRHLPGSQMPADVGTKVLPIEKFIYLKGLLGMESLLVRNQKKESGEVQRLSAQDTQIVLKALILVAKISQVQAQGDLTPFGTNLEPEVISLWFILWFIFVVLMVGILIGMGFASMAVNRQTREIEAMLRPNFLPSIQESTETLMPTQVEALLPGLRQRGGLQAAAGLPSSSAAGAAVLLSCLLRALLEQPLPGRLLRALLLEPPLPGRLLRALLLEPPLPGRLLRALLVEPPLLLGRLLRTLLLEPPLPGRLLRALLVEPPLLLGRILRALLEPPLLGCRLRALLEPPLLGCLLRELPSSSADGAAAALPSGAAGAAAMSGQTGSQGIRWRAESRTAFITTCGEKMHASRFCHGLRKARQVFEVELCPNCCPSNFVFGAPMYTTGPDDRLHRTWDHVRECGMNGPIRTLTMCQICRRWESRNGTSIERAWACFVFGHTFSAWSSCGWRPKGECLRKYLNPNT